MIDDQSKDWETPTDRKCGSCAVCCKIMQVPEYIRAKGAWCPKARPGDPRGACSIYNDRPVGCRGFACLWLLGAGSPDDRPDKLGVMFAAKGEHAKGTFKVAAFEARPGRLLSPRSRELIRFLLTTVPVTAMRIVRGEIERVELPILDEPVIPLFPIEKGEKSGIPTPEES
jgi:hypothetical protein